MAPPTALIKAFNVISQSGTGNPGLVASGISEALITTAAGMVVGIPALAYTVYLLYTGVPIMMGISEERGFLFSSAVLAVGLVAFVALLAITALLWGMGLEPTFTR